MIRITGTSDDLIEIDCDISEEFPWQTPGYGQASGDLLAFSDGTVLRITFTQEGTWRITPVIRGTAVLNIDQAPEGEDGTDTATLDGDVTWVMQGIAYARAGAS